MYVALNCLFSNTVVEFLYCFRDTSVFILLHLWNSVTQSNLTGVFSSLEVLKVMVCLIFDGWNAIFEKFLTIPGKTCIHKRRHHGRWPTHPSSSKEWMWNCGRAQMLALYMHSDFILWSVSRLGTPSGFPGAKPGVDPSQHLQRRKHWGIFCLHRWEVWPLKTMRSQWRHACNLCHSHNIYIKQQQGASLVLTGGESTCQCRGYRFDPWSGRIPHAMKQLSSCTTTIESML